MNKIIAVSVLAIIIIIIIIYLNNRNKSIFIPLNSVPYSQGDELFKKCVDEVSSNNIVDKDKLIKCTHKYCANMRNDSLDSGSLVTNLIPLKSFDNGSDKKEFYVSVCCTSDYCRMIFEDSHRYKKFGNHYYLIKSNNDYGDKVVQILFDKNENYSINGTHRTGLSGNLTLEKLKDICKI